MKVEVKSPKEYVDNLPEERKAAFKKLRAVINKNIPKGFKECINYGMLGWVVPKSVYPPGYHVGKDLPLPFMNLANQKGFIGVYHMGVYSDPKLLKWFQEEFAKRSEKKLDMGKSCVRLKHIDKIPFDLFGELASKMTTDNWVATYEKALKK